MKTLALAFLFGASTYAQAAWCVGADPCRACKDCSQCAYCNAGKGSCSVLRNLTPEQQKKRNKRLVKS